MFRLPSFFGGRKTWTIPIAQVAVVDPTRATDLLDDPGDGWVFRDQLVVPYAATTTNNVSANLTLYFITPQRIPRLRWFGSSTLGLSYRESRSATGTTVDGIGLRAEDPDTAVATLVAAGVQRIDRPNAWLREHRATTSDPERIEAVAAGQRRAKLSLNLSLVLMVAAGALRFVGLPPTLDIVGAAGALAASFGVLHWLGRKNDRSQATGRTPRPLPQSKSRR